MRFGRNLILFQPAQRLRLDFTKGEVQQRSPNRRPVPSFAYEMPFGGRIFATLGFNRHRWSPVLGCLGTDNTFQAGGRLFKCAHHLGRYRSPYDLGGGSIAWRGRSVRLGNSKRKNLARHKMAFPKIHIFLYDTCLVFITGIRGIHHCDIFYLSIIFINFQFL